MRYMLLIYENEKLNDAQSEAERNAVFGEYFEFTRKVRESGKFQAGDPLLPVSSAQTVRVRNGAAVTTDGPFAETREQLGGYYIVDCASLEEAVTWAAQIPGAKTGAIEVRPIMDMGG